MTPTPKKPSKTNTSLSKGTTNHKSTTEIPSNAQSTTNPTNSTQKPKKKKEVLLKHLSSEEKQKIAHLILTIHQLTEQKIFYETKYASLLPKLKQIMEKFEERTKRLAQYQNAMKKMKGELDEWKDRSVKLRDQVRVVEREREEWRERYEELYLEKQRHEEVVRDRRHRSVQLNVDDLVPVADASVQAYLPDERFAAKQQNFSVEQSTLRHSSASIAAPQNHHPFIEMPRVNTSFHAHDDNLSQISDTESIASIRQREVDDLLRRSEAVLNRSRASRPSTPDELLETRRRREALLRKSVDLHRVSETHEFQNLTLQQYESPPVYNQRDIQQSNRFVERQAQLQQQMRNASNAPTKEDANDLFHFVDILEQQPDTTLDRHNGLLDHSENPLSETHVSFISAAESEYSHATTVFGGVRDASEAWFERADTFQENDIFDIIG